MSWWSVVAAMAVVFVQAAPPPDPAAEPHAVGAFSAAEPGSRPSGWRERTSSRMRPTRYVIVETDAGTALEAQSDASASALARPVSIDAPATPLVEWRWRIDRVIPDAAWGTREGDDFAARLFIVFEPRERQRLRWLVNPARDLLDGVALSYVWANQGEPGRMARSPATDRVMMIAVQAGPTRAGEWVHEQRNVVEDFGRAFGGTPRRIRAVAVMTDTDDTRSALTTLYGDITFVGG